MDNPTNAKVKQSMLDRLRKEKYLNWLIELKSGFNLLFYGVGSKKSVLEDFGKLFCCRDPQAITLRVNGFMDDLLMKQFMEKLVEVIINKTEKTAIRNDRDPVKRAENVVRYLEEEGVQRNLRYRYFYLIVHNITGKALRKKKIQRALSVLANCRFIHLIASIDHIHGMLMWDRNDLSSFHWIYHDITTFKHYFAEMELEQGETIKLSNNSTNHGLEHIMSSLTPIHRDIIQILAEHQVANDGVGLPQVTWYEQCENNMLVSNDLKFKQYITEFIDHNVIVKQKVQGNMLFTIPYPEDVIERELIDYDPES